MKEELNRINSEKEFSERRSSLISDGEEIKTIEFKESENTYKPPSANSSA
jgi:hypothetical protein